MPSVRALVMSVGLFASIASAHAAVVFDSLSGTTNANESVNSILGQGPLGMEFTTGSDLNLSSVVLNLNGDNTNTGGSLVVTIQADSSNSPSATTVATLGTISDTSMAANSAYSQFTLTPSTPVQLSASTNYWVMLTDTSTSPATDPSSIYLGTSINWATTADLTGTGVSGSNAYYSSAVTPAASGAAFQMSVTMTSSQQQQPAPEPDGLALFGVGLLALGAVIRRRSQTSG